MKRMILVGLIASLYAPHWAFAEVLPSTGFYDPRVKHVDYNPDDVVRIIGHYGFSTDVEFSSEETVQSVALGDSLAWEVAPRGNQLFIKPREDNATTNLTVITNKRTYQFWLDAAEAKNKGRGSEMYFRVRFSYPREETAAALAEANKKRAEAALKKTIPLTNWNYYSCGNARLKPLEAYDDGRFTYLRFPGSQQVPAAYVINSDGTESLASGSMHGDQLVLQMTAPKIILRKGKAVACLENRSYNWYGIYNVNGTTSPDVVRKINDAAIPHQPALPAADQATAPDEDEDTQPPPAMIGRGIPTISPTPQTQTTEGN